MHHDHHRIRWLAAGRRHPHLPERPERPEQRHHLRRDWEGGQAPEFLAVTTELHLGCDDNPLDRWTSDLTLSRQEAHAIPLPGG
jgi:hypothetical protein